MSELISITGLNKSYGKKHVVSDVNLNIHKGQIVGLVGPNGAGKTTCLQSLLGLIDFEVLLFAACIKLIIDFTFN